MNGYGCVPMKRYLPKQAEDWIWLWVLFCLSLVVAEVRAAILDQEVGVMYRMAGKQARRTLSSQCSQSYPMSPLDFIHMRE